MYLHCRKYVVKERWTYFRQEEESLGILEDQMHFGGIIYKIIMR